MMKPLPSQRPSFKPLHKMLTGAISSRLLMGGLTLGVFNVLGNWQIAEQVATDLDTDTGNTECILDGLTNIGLLEKREGRYRNLPLSNIYLSSRSEYYIGDLFSMIRRMSIDPLEHLEELVQKGPGLIQTEDEPDSQDRWVKSAKASMPWALGEMGTRIARIVGDLPDFSGFKKMVDLGGGHGLFSLYIVQASRALEAVVFDHATVAGLASETISSYDMEKRVSVMAGDYLTDDFGCGYDLVFASATLNSAKNVLHTLISRIYDSLTPDGYFISLHDGMSNENTQPGLILEWLGGLLGSGQDFRFKQGELADIMLRCGFRTVRSVTIETPIGLMELDMARK